MSVAKLVSDGNQILEFIARIANHLNDPWISGVRCHRKKCHLMMHLEAVEKLLAFLLSFLNLTHCALVSLE